MEIERHNHSVSQSVFHFTWTPKCRYKMFRKLKYKNACEGILRSVAARHKIGINELNVLSNHVHIIVKLHPSMSISRAQQLLKGASAYELFKRFPQLRLRYPRGHFWSAGTYSGTVGDADFKTVCKYVREQTDEFQEQSTLTDF